MTGFTHILHATDFSESSELALARAVDLARQCGAKLTLIHAYVGPLMSEGFAYVPDIRPELEERLAKVAEGEPDVEFDRVLRVGTPAEAIVDYARDHNCDLIVIGTHGRTGLTHMLMGSVAEKVVRLAECPVMVVGLRTAEKARPVRDEHKSDRSVAVV
jgi:nucleotide-binding universal stress UspA family protein